MKQTAKADAVYFESPLAFRRWLQKHHHSATELVVGFHKSHTGRPTLTWPESVDEALCFGWIDGVRHRINDEAYRIRFTPRKPSGIWSQVNIKRFAELKAEGRTTASGQAAYDVGAHRTKLYSHERPLAEFASEELEAFQANAAAWARFQAFPPSYRKVALHRVTSAKGEATRARRLAILIDASARGLKLRSPTQVDD